MIEYHRRRKAEDPEAARQAHRNAMQRYRKKQKILEHYNSVEDYWRERAREKDENVTGLDYGKKQAERTLAEVTKIETGENNYDNENNQDE